MTTNFLVGKSKIIFQKHLKSQILSFPIYRGVEQSSLRFYEDSDIKTERVMIEDMDKYKRRAHNLILDNVTKIYGDLKAVDRVCLCLSE